MIAVQVMRAALAAVLLLTTGQAYGAATLLPNAKNCFQATIGTNGLVGTLGAVTGGTGGTAGTYGGVSLTGGSGSGATANITVSGGAVTAVTVLNPGTQYVVGDTLSAVSGAIGNVAGFSVPVASVAINSSLAGGSVTFYIPNTTTFKNTWSNAAQSALNANPVLLDQNGCATIYGTGSYRQILKDALGNTVWDAVTADTSANDSTFWAGTAGGTPNVITVVDSGFNATDGSIINFTALATNTASATLNPSGFGAIPILKDTTAGPVALTGTEIIQGNPISVIFRASDNSFHLLNTAIASASGATAPLCGAVGLKITNSPGTPNTIINLTASQIVMQTASGLTINRSNVSLTNINITTGAVTSTANGMDGESAGTSAWVYIWAIDNGAAVAGLVSAAALNGLSPTLPSGYTYKCRLGAMRVDGSSNLLRTIQIGSRSEYVPTAATNTTQYPNMITGASGACGVGTFTSVALAGFVPTTAARITASLLVSGATTAAMNGNNGTGGIVGSGGNSSIAGSISVASLTSIQTVEMILQGSNIFYCSNGASNSADAVGWTDAVNAN